MGQISDGIHTADIIANDQISHAEEYRVRFHRGLSNHGKAVRLADVADVEDATSNVRSAGYLDASATSLIIFRQPGY